MQTKITREAPYVISFNIIFKFLHLLSVLPKGTIRDAVRNMIRNVLVMTSSLALLPSSCATNMKLAYYEEGFFSCITLA